ncbi:MAG: Ppx/GppA family phosphatase [Deltaproteobacteria bacterium]|nr:Ppx/GppA family phosphatase [Deltaproteobacteria bacterium]MBW2349785.1 Ppx/GppA family phosphatase [Deltaproteobacteria bacterium]
MHANFREKTIAAIDLGSQTFRVAVVRIVDNRPQVLASELKNVRLGQGLSANGRLNENAIKRGIETLRDFRNVFNKFRVSDVIACGTAALRNAANAGEFLDLAGAEGFNIKILSGDEEAFMSVMGVRTSLPDISAPFLVVDVGGGSSEVVLATSNKTLFNWSLNIGAVNLTEEFIRTDPPLPGELEKLGFHIRQKLSDLPAKLPEFPKTVVGVGGTATTLAAMALGMKKYDPRRIRGYALGSQELDKLWNFLTGMKIHTRRSISGLESRRADIILSGIAIFRDILHITEFKELTVSDGGLLLGLLTSLIEKESYNHAEPPNTKGLYL